MRTVAKYFISIFHKWLWSKRTSRDQRARCRTYPLSQAIRSEDINCNWLSVLWTIHYRRLSVTHILAFPTYKPTKDLRSQDLQVGQSSAVRIAFTEIWSWKLHLIFFSNTAKIANLMCKPYLPIISEFLRSPANDMRRLSDFTKKIQISLCFKCFLWSTYSENDFLIVLR